MTRAEQRFEQIEQYLRRQMSPEEAAAFEAEMAADADLAELVQQHRLERQGLELLVERDLLAQMQAWDRETALLQSVAPPRRTGASPLKVLFRAAAIAAVFVTAFFGWWLLRDSGSGSVPETTPVAEAPAKDKKKSPVIRKPAPAKPSAPKTAPYKETETEDGLAGQEQPRQAETPAPIEEIPETATAVDYAALAGEFYRERDFIPPKGSKGGGSASYNQALDNYRDGRLGNVITQLKPEMNQGADALLRRELLGHTYYKNGQFEAAFEEFRALAATRQQPYAQRAEWAMALTLLHQMPAKKALLDRVLAGILADPGHPFYSQAKALKNRGL
ncbi:MAG: hypothetical protein L6Q97_14280 [Thermoanaerobaculia bacterium]|nr:hypothetical protein [Thermoanaerobaculia bacterium]